jgi:putative oxidoreductase
MSPEFDKRIPAALLILRFFLGTFLLQWSIEKLILPDAAARIASNFYGVTLPVAGSYALGIAELIVSLALLVGFYRTISYGLSLLIHTVTVVVSWRQLFDPWGLAKVGNHLWLSTWPTWGDFAALFLMREWDTWTVDGWRQSRRAPPTAIFCRSLSACRRPLHCRLVESEKPTASPQRSPERQIDHRPDGLRRRPPCCFSVASWSLRTRRHGVVSDFEWTFVHFCSCLPSMQIMTRRLARFAPSA